VFASEVFIVLSIQAKRLENLNSFFSKTLLGGLFLPFGSEDLLFLLERFKIKIFSFDGFTSFSSKIITINSIYDKTSRTNIGS